MRSGAAAWVRGCEVRDRGGKRLWHGRVQSEAPALQTLACLYKSDQEQHSIHTSFAFLAALMFQDRVDQNSDKHSSHRKRYNSKYIGRKCL